VGALNPERVGHCYTPSRYEVSREKIREYAAATGHDEDRYQAEVGEIVAPPTFAACFTVNRLHDLLADPELGAHTNLVHGAQSFEFHRPLRAGQALSCTPRITDIVQRSAMELLTYEVDCVDADTGEPVVTGQATIIFFVT